MFEQRHLNELARALKASRNIDSAEKYWVWRTVQLHIASMCGASNPKFKRQLFNEACGVTDEAFASDAPANERAAALLKLAAE